MAVRTFRRSGTPVDTPVWPIVADGKLYFGTPEHTHKVTRIQSNLQVQVAMCDSRGNTTGPWTDGQARVLTANEFEPYRQRIDQRHPIACRAIRLVAKLRRWNYVGIEITQLSNGS
ncbi:MAG: PPOX class F420-dependent oxidoreductase [Acidimicrobiia bacterium]|nr:PPOX class F420-dependent oxidoreductase [Acidimicrobiia bacterium]MDH5292599.1 PPOX class F420-dependent oxidoreductase [Acidimicrobiia bacterium]